VGVPPPAAPARSTAGSLRRLAKGVPQHMKFWRRAVLTVAIGVLTWSVQDAIAWRLLSERWRFDHDPVRGAIYQVVHQDVLVALIAIGAILLARSPWHAAWCVAATWTLCYGGLADALYYWIALQPIPQSLPWLDDPGHIVVLFHPATADSILLSSGVWLTIWTLALLLGNVTYRAASTCARTAPR
jgi:hypothetical protein